MDIKDFQMLLIDFNASLLWTSKFVDLRKSLETINRRDGVVIRASALQSVDLGFIPLVESYQKTLKNDIHSFPAWHSAFVGCCGKQAGKFACFVLGQDT